MNFSHLKAFHCVAETGNFTQAAKELFLTQPAVSMQIQALEHSLGVPLFDRSRRRITMTPEGIVLHTYTQKIFGLVQELSDEFHELTSVLTGHLQLGATTIMGAYYLPYFVSTFHQQYPGVQLTLSIHNSRTVAEMVCQGEVELGFGGSSSAHSSLSRYFLHREPLLIVCGKDSPFAKNNAPLCADDIADETFIMREPGTRATDKVINWFKAHSATEHDAALITVKNMETTKQLVAKGLGVTFLPRHAAELEIATGQLIPLNVKNFDLHVDYFLTYMPGRRLSRVSRSFLSLLFEKGVPLPDDLAEKLL